VLIVNSNARGEGNHNLDAYNHKRKYDAPPCGGARREGCISRLHLKIPTQAELGWGTLRFCFN